MPAFAVDHAIVLCLTNSFRRKRPGMMYGPLVEQLSLKYGVQVGFLCTDGVSGLFSKTMDSTADLRRIQYLDLWRPSVVVWADYWASDPVSLFTGFEPFPAGYLDFEATLRLLRNYPG